MVKIQHKLCFCERGMLPLGNLNGELSGQLLKGCKDYVVFPLLTASGGGEPQWHLACLTPKVMGTECWWEQGSSSGEMIDGALWPLPAWEHSKKVSPTAQPGKRGKKLLFQHLFIPPPVPTASQMQQEFLMPPAPEAGCAGAGSLQPGNTCFCSQSVAS